jgi:hypothetical protein
VRGGGTPTTPSAAEVEAPQVRGQAHRRPYRGIGGRGGGSGYYYYYHHYYHSGVEITTRQLAKCEWNLELASNFINLLASLASAFFPPLS